MINIIKGFFLWAFTGFTDWQKERLAICNECAPAREICPECKCFKEPKAKVKSESCPKGKWDNIKVSPPKLMPRLKNNK